jgi:hypothetical protein
MRTYGKGGSARDDKGAKENADTRLLVSERSFSEQTAEFCEDRNLRIIVLTSLWETLED